VAIVNESFAHQLLGARDPIGSTFQMPASPGATQPVIEIVGLVRDAKYTSLRTREIGIRTALGARPSEVVRLVLRQGAWLTVPGVALGLALSAAATRLFRGLLFGLPPVDPMTFIGVAVAFAMVTALSAYLPARRAANVDPLIALRSE
jgi:predicted lysophospholipase L1 biosynthesis ABC-type transport system permease subunit